MNENKPKHTGWIGVDFDGTLAEYHGWKGDFDLGKPIPAMAERVKRWHAEGREVRILTARVSYLPGEDYDHGRDRLSAVRGAIRAWCKYHLGFELHVTCEKDIKMCQLWDDRCVCVERNTGRVIGCPNDMADVFADVEAVCNGGQTKS